MKKTKELEECIKLYIEVFGDSKKLAEQVFFKEENLLFYKCEHENNKIVSVAFCRKKYLRIGDEIFEVPFLFGIATHKDYRHQGRSSRVINKLLEEIKKNNYLFAMLCPANEGLYKFYEAFGFSRFNSVYKTQLGYLIKENSQIIQATKKDINECVNLFREYNKKFYMAQERKEEDMLNRLNEIIIDKGRLFFIEKDGEKYGYILDDGNAKIEEIISLYSSKIKNDINSEEFNNNQEVYVQENVGEKKSKEVINIFDEKIKLKMIQNNTFKECAFYEEW